MKTIAVVPMKLNNSRLPQKNTKAFKNGHPLCHYILSTLLEIKGLDAIYVYCSNPDIQNYIPQNVHYLQRSKLLDTDDTKMNEILLNFSKEVDADVYLMTHTTAPFIKASTIQRGLEAVWSQQYDSAFSAKRLQDFLWKEGKPLNYELDNIPRTQDLEVIYEETSGFYIYEKSIIQRLGRRIGNKPKIIEVGEIESIDIDEKEDFDIAEAIYNYCFLNDEK